MTVTFGHIRTHQINDDTLTGKNKNDKSYQNQTFHGAGKTYDLTCKNNRIVIPNILKQRILDWYYTALVYSERDRTERKISQHIYWKGMHEDIEKYCKKCHR